MIESIKNGFREAWSDSLDFRIVVTFCAFVLVFFPIIVLYSTVGPGGPQVDPAPEAPDFESIERSGEFVRIEDRETKIFFVRVKSVVWVSHWAPGKHPEGRPWDTVEVGFAAKAYRLDCRRSEDADKIIRLLTRGENQ